MKGNALTTFNKAANEHGLETNNHFKECTKDTMVHMFPAKAKQMQKQWMYKFMQKTQEMSIQEHVSRATEINECLEHFLSAPSREKATKLKNDEFLESLENCVPDK